MASVRSYGAIAIAIFGWGLSTIFIEQGLRIIGPYTFLFLRFFISFIVVTPFMKNKKDIIIKMINNKWVWMIGVSEAIGLTLQYMGQEKLVPPGLSSLLSLIFLIIVPFLSFIVLKETIHLKHFIAIIIGIIGVIAITSDQNFSGKNLSTIGVIFLLLSAFSYAVYIVTTSRYSTVENKELDIFALFYIVLLIISIVSFSFGLFFEHLFVPMNNELFMWLILLIIFSTIIAFIAYFEALKEISANSASILLLFQMTIPFTIEFILGTRYNFKVWVGILFLLLSMIIVLSIKNDSK